MITGISGDIYPQKDCSFNIYWFNTDNRWSGNFLLKNAENLNIEFISGKIYENKNFIYHVTPNQYIELSGNFSKDFVNYFLNKKFLYSRTGNFQEISGFYLNWTTGYIWSDLNFLPQISFYGEQPQIDFVYSTTGTISEPIKVSISGNQNNNGPFEIYSGRIGFYENDPQSYYFAISGVENFASGIKIDNGEIFDINILPINTQLPNRNTYIPLALITNAGTIGQNLFVNRLNAPQNQSFSVNINNSISLLDTDLLYQS